MSFPVIFKIGSWQIPAHFVFESLAYFFAFQIFLYQKRRQQDPLSTEHRYAIIAAAVMGAAIGSKLLYYLIDPVQTLQKWNDLYYLMSGKTIVGALAGGLFAVEGTKKILHIQARSGDLFAIPLTFGIAIGRIGCFLSGLNDHTHGLATQMPWGVDLGDGLHRHPVQLYEILFLMTLAIFLIRMQKVNTQKKSLASGDLFKLFMIAYFSFRLLIDFIKPGIFFWGLNAIQWTCVAMLIYYSGDLLRFLSMKKIKKREWA